MEYLNSIDDSITSVDENNIEYIDLFQHPELVYGTLNLSGEGLDFCKYPQDVQKEMERYGELAVKEMANLNSSACGTRLRISTDSKVLVLKVQLKRKWEYQKMTNWNASGFDVYALKNDNVGYYSKTYENLDIKNIKVLMDLLPEDDLKCDAGDLIISHHPPLFMPKTPTYVVHSNWDIINGGSNDALAFYLGLKPISVFHKKTGIGRICSSTKTLDQFLSLVCYKFGPENVRLVNDGDFDKMLRKIAIVSGFGLSNKEFISHCFRIWLKQ